MLKLINNKFIVESADLRRYGLRSPMGFSFCLSEEAGIGNYFWTTDLFAAYLFYKRYREATQEVDNYFEGILAKQKELYELSYATTSKTDYPTPDGVKFRSYQNAGIDYCLLADNILIADQMRLGKTGLSIGLINSSNATKVLIICPKTAKLVWVKELQTFLTKDLNVQVLGAQTEFDENADIYIANYDVVFKIKELQKINFDLIIGDEIHLCKNADARRSKFFFALEGKKKLGLSGTPLLNKPKDLLTVLQWLDEFWKDCRIYKEQFAFKSGIVLTLEEVQDLIRSTVMLRRLQSDVFDTEPIERRVVPLEASPELRPQIEIEKESYKKSWKLDDYTKARHLIGLARVQPAINHILTYSSEGEKIVTFCYHKTVVDRIAASLGHRAVKLYGDTNDAERKLAIERFNNDPECIAIIGSIPAMGVAINLSVSSHIVFAESTYSDGEMAQAEERCSDKNNKRPVLVEYLCYEGSLDEHMANIRTKKEIIANDALDMI